MKEQTVHKSSALPQAPARRSPLRTLIVLLLASIVLLAFIAWLGDWRRRHNVQTLMQEQVGSYAKLLASTGQLPLNLRAGDQDQPAPRIFEAWLTTDQARVLRSEPDEVLVAWTIPLVRALGPNERAVIVFHQGRFDVRWLALGEFDAWLARQTARAQSLGA